MLRTSTALAARTRGGAVITVTAALALALAGCGSSASTNEPSGAAPASASNREGGPRMDPAMQQKIEQCLKAAGLPVPSFGPRPSRAPGETPPATPPTHTPGQNRGGEFANPQVRAALQACGITLPSRPPGAAPATAAPS